MEFTLPELPYAYDALEPFYDEETVKIHHDKHHAGYVKGLNNAMAKLEEARESGDFSLIKHWEREQAFHGAGHFLHSMFWENMHAGKEDNKAEDADFLEAIDKGFGSWENFEKQFKAATAAVEGSGWGVLAKDHKGGLHVFAVENHQKIFVPGLTPIMVCDVWEHSYYKKWGPDRKGWIDSFWYIVNWDYVAEGFNN
jgi:superoxide dismutase, Fe-Mn family